MLHQLLSDIIVAPIQGYPYSTSVQTGRISTVPQQDTGQLLISTLSSPLQGTVKISTNINVSRFYQPCDDLQVPLLTSYLKRIGTHTTQYHLGALSRRRRTQQSDHQGRLPVLDGSQYACILITCIMWRTSRFGGILHAPHETLQLIYQDSLLRYTRFKYAQFTFQFINTIMEHEVLVRKRCKHGILIQTFAFNHRRFYWKRMHFGRKKRVRGAFRILFFIVIIIIIIIIIRIRA